MVKQSEIRKVVMKLKNLTTLNDGRGAIAVALGESGQKVEKSDHFAIEPADTPGHSSNDKFTVYYVVASELSFGADLNGGFSVGKLYLKRR
jgi:hypothetical protein